MYCRWKGISLKINSRKHIWAFIGGAIALGIHWTSYFYALHLAGVAIGMLSLFTYPVMTSLLEPLWLKTRLRMADVFLAVIIMFGIFLLVPEFSLDNDYTIGALLGLGSALLYSIRNIMLKKYIRIYPGTQMMFYQLLFNSLWLWPALILFDHSGLIPNIAPLIALGVITTAIGHTIFVNSLKHFTVSAASIISSFQPVLGIAIAALFLDEIPTWKTVVGGLLILLTVLLENVKTYKNVD